LGGVGLGADQKLPQFSSVFRYLNQASAGDWLIFVDADTLVNIDVVR